jgi:hypothetical protein
MATRVPETKTVRYMFTGGLEARQTSTTKDKRFVNLYEEKVTKDGTDTIMVKRAGLVSHIDLPNGVGRGLQAFNNKLWTVVGNKLYRDTTEVLTLTTSTGKVGFTEATQGGATVLFFCDGTDAYFINTSDVITQVTTTYSAWAATTAYVLTNRRRPTVVNNLYYEVTTAGTSAASEPTWPTTINTTVTDGTVVWTCKGYYGGFPSPHIASPIFIDGYVMLAKSGTADIYNCYLENVDSWSPADFVTSEMFPDDIKALARQNNQVVAFGEYGTEFFYDNGANQASGSPLARNQNTFLQIGTPSPSCIGQSEQHCFFIGVSLTGGRTLWKLDGFTPVAVGTPSIDRVLTEEGTNISTSTGYLVRVSGHFFFVVCLTSRTLVYDIDLNLWHEWNSTSQNRYNTSQINGDDLNVLAINDNGSESIFTSTAFVWRYATDTCSCANNGKIYVLHESSGIVAYFDPNVYTDLGQVIRCEANTSSLDFGNYNRKFMHRVTVLGDQASNVIFLKWTDDDYQTWSSLKYLSIATRPVFHRLGSFRRRAFNVYYTDDAPLRLDGLEFDYSEGAS